MRGLAVVGVGHDLELVDLGDLEERVDHLAARPHSSESVMHSTLVMVIRMRYQAGSEVGGGGLLGRLGRLDLRLEVGDHLGWQLELRLADGLRALRGVDDDDGVAAELLAELVARPPGDGPAPVTLGRGARPGGG